VKNLTNSPYTTLINPYFQTTDSACNEQCHIDNQYDAFKLYPENYMMPDGRIYLTREVISQFFSVSFYLYIAYLILLLCVFIFFKRVIGFPFELLPQNICG
jgi:hypothetical protein